MTKIKICGLFRPEDIEAVNEGLPDYAGFVFAKSPRQVTIDKALEFRELLSPHITAVGVFRNAPLATIKQAIDLDVSDIIQLHGDEDEEFIRELREYTPRPIIKAVAVTSSDDIERWQNSAANYLLLDNKEPGSGQKFDWNLIHSCEKPFFLAGGLDHDNVIQAIEELNPYAVDVSSGVETNGLKDQYKILSIIRRIRND